MTEDLTQFGIASPERAATVNKKHFSCDRITSGCQVLSFLQNRAMIDRGIDLFFQSIEFIHIHCGESIMRQWVSQLWFTHGHTLSTQNPSQIRQLCHLLCENTATAQVFDGSTTARQWIYSATGQNIRWGVIAMIAVYIGTYAMVANPSDPFFKEFNADRESLLRHMTEVSDVCIGFCRECGALDNTFICALFEYYNITKYTKGEACYTTYCIGAELNSALVVMGLHQEIKPSSKVPFFLAELHKRLRAMIYMEEISIATFLGRPPRLSHRYINLDPPLDLIDSHLFSEDPQELAVAVANLDEQGYNRDGEIRHLSWIRSSIGFMKRREDILELSLGNLSADEVRQNAKLIEQKTEEHWATLPPVMLNLRYTFGLETQNVIELHFQNVFRQGPQANSLLLHRILMRKAGTGPAGLIHTAQIILSDVMRLYKRVEMLAATSSIYFLAVHGLRSAVILAIELLKQEQLPVYPNEPLLPRSKTIQDLCVFTNRLSDLNSIFGDRELCEKGRKLISRVLDTILSPSNTADRRNHVSSMPAQQLGAKGFNDTFPNLNVPCGYPITDDFSYEMSAPVSAPDHVFRLWLEDIDDQDWDTVM
jgi:hypothetical protein